MFRGFMYISGNMWMVWVIPVVLLLLIGISMVMIAKNNKDTKNIKRKPAMDKLDERYATGDVSEDEYKRIKSNLNNT